MNPSHSQQQTGHGSTFEPGDIGLGIVERGGGKIANPADQLAYIVSAVRPGRKIRFTLHNTRTDKHLTYQVETARGPAAAGEGRRRFVSVLTGSDNEGSYTYLGTIFDRGPDRYLWRWSWWGRNHHAGAIKTRWQYHYGAKSKVGRKAVSQAGFMFLMVSLIPEYPSLPSWYQFWHEGRCGRCGRTLTDPESCARGLGSVCAGKGAG